MIRLSPPENRRLEQTTLLELTVGGSELNAAVAASRLGLKAAYVTRLTNNPLGHLVENKAREHGVDTTHFRWTDEDRVGLYFVEFGASPRPNSVFYDRAESAIARIRPGDIDWTSLLDRTKLFYTSGITPALSAGATEATLEAVAAAAESDALVCVDLNYRARLWTQEKARSVMTEIVKQTDILFATEEDTLRVFGIQEGSYEDVAKRLADTFDLKIVAITLRENPSVWRNQWTAIAYDAAADTIHRAPVMDIEVVDRVGSGDSFVGGFLFGYLQAGAAAGVRYGVGMSALKQTIPGDLCWANLGEVERVLEGQSLRIVR